MLLTPKYVAIIEGIATLGCILSVYKTDIEMERKREI